MRYRVYVGGQPLPDTVLIPNLRRLYDAAVVSLDKAKSKDDNCIRINRRLSSRPISLQFVLPLGENRAFDGVEAKASGFALRVVFLEEIDANGDGQAEAITEVFELTLETVVVVDREFNIAAGQDVLHMQSMSPLRKKLLKDAA